MSTSMPAGLLHLGVHRGEENTFLHVSRRIAHRVHGALESGNRPVPDRSRLRGHRSQELGCNNSKDLKSHLERECNNSEAFTWRGLVELVLRGEVVRMLLVPHVLLILDGLLQEPSAIDAYNVASCEERIKSHLIYDLDVDFNVYFRLSLCHLSHHVAKFNTSLSCGF